MHSVWPKKDFRLTGWDIFNPKVYVNEKVQPDPHPTRIWTLGAQRNPTQPVFDRSLVEAVQGIALSRNDRVPFAQIWDIFSLFCHVFIKTSLGKSLSIMTCLDMFENRIKLHHKHYDMSGHVWESHQITSKALWHVRTGLKIISNHIMTCLDMFVESYQIVSEYF